MQRSRLKIAAIAALLVALPAALPPMVARAASAPPAATIPPVQQAAGTPLRDVDWNSVLAADPNVEPLDGCLPISPLTPPLPCINVPLTPATVIGPAADTGASGAVAGSAATLPGDVIYGDIDGDGQEEAVIRVESGGTAGTIGFLLYHQAPGAPHLAGVFPGYKIGVSIDGGVLTVAMPFYFPGEGNCCPTATMIDRFQLSGDSLISVAQTEWDLNGEQQRPATTAELTVYAFYRDLGNRDLELAYALTSAAYKASHPFDQWVAGYANTQSIAALTAPGDTPDSVLVQITATDQAPGAAPVTRTFSGSWTLVPAASAPLGWLLDRASIR